MKVPLEIHFREGDPTPALGATAKASIPRNPCRVRIEVSVPPGKRLVVRRESSQGEMHTPLQKVVGEAFEAMERRLRETADVRRGAVKHHARRREMIVATDTRT